MTVTFTKDDKTWIEGYFVGFASGKKEKHKKLVSQIKKLKMKIRQIQRRKAISLNNFTGIALGLCVQKLKLFWNIT